MGNDDTRDDWDSFGGSAWGHEPDAEEASPNGHAPQDEAPRDGFLRPALADVDDEGETSSHATSAGRWVTRGGVLRWEAAKEEDAGEEAPLREEAQSAWADDDIDLPLGAPASARLRAVRAWIGRRRLRETELIGALLLERRRLTAPDKADDDEGESRSTPPENPNDPLALALAEAQAAADEYETLLGQLEDIRAHAGAQSALIEFYLSINERLAALAALPAAPEGFASAALFAEIERQTGAGEVTPSARSEWEGRTGAALATRKRVERVNASEPEDD